MNILKRILQIKTILILLFLFITTEIYSQPGDSREKIYMPHSYLFVIDTVKFSFSIPEIINVTSYIPQLKSKDNFFVFNKINNDLKKYFIATSKDSAAFIEYLLDNNDVKSVEEYKQLLKTDADVDKEDESEYFLVTYLSDNLLNITISRDVMPHNGQIQHFFNSVLYDLRTGEKLKISDFLNIQSEQLTKFLKEDGYFIEEYSDAENSIAMKPIDSTDEFVNEIVKYIFPNDSNDVLCTDYYFTKEENEIHLRFKYQCSGPQFLTYGISINKLIPYIKYFDFKNALKLWGIDITSLVGTDYNLLGNTIEFKDYSIKETAGYFMKTGPKYPNKKFGIVTWSNAKSWFYMFLKYNVNSSKTIITDVCEINKEYLKDKYFITMDQETSKECDPETIAILESKVGLKKIKTWQVNKQTGKIEIIEH